MNRKIKFLGLLSFFIIGSTVCISQNKQDIELVRNIYKPDIQKLDFREYTKENHNEVHWIASGLFIIYKSFFSSQDANRCVFHPSCSVYAMQSLKQHGIIPGLADAMDRLSRCNRLSPENYSYYEDTKLFSDPVK